MAKVTGLDDVLKNLNTEIRAIENRTGDGLLAAALFVQGESQEDTPQRKGVLVNSAFSDVDRENLVARVGYTACLLYTSPSPRDRQKSRMPSSA